MFLSYKGKKSIEELESEIFQKLDSISHIGNDYKNGVYLYGDNFLGLLSLLKNYENKIDLVYIDPPFNTKSIFYYDENKISTISSAKINVAYCDKMNMYEYLELIRRRLILIKKLLSPSGSLYFHIDLKVGHYIKVLLDEVFGFENFVNDITRIKSNPKNFNKKSFGNQKDVIYIYSKIPKNNIFNDIKTPFHKSEIEKRFSKIDIDGRRYTTIPCHAPGETINGITGKKWKELLPPKGRHWRYIPKELEKMDEKGLIEWSKNGNPRIKKYADEHEGARIQDIWLDFKDPQNPIYPTEKNINMLSMIVKQSSNPDSIIMDCFCGSGAFLEAGILQNRFVIGIDNSSFSLKAIKNRESLRGISIVDIF